MVKIKKLAIKMQIALNILFMVVMLPLIITVSVTNHKETKQRSAGELSNSTMILYNMTSLYVNTSVENRLRAIAEKTRSLIRMNYDKVQQGKLESDEGFQNVRDIILDPDYGKIGTTGYMAGVSSKGILSIHPHSEGVDASGLDFMKEAISRKNGYIEYEWQNKDETEPRMKAGYMSYFAPWDIIVWASSYKDEFNFLIDVELLKETISRSGKGETGYTFILDKNGDIIYHPYISAGNMFQASPGSNGVNQLKKTAENAFVQQGVPFPCEYINPENNLTRTASIVYYDVLEWYLVTSSSNKEIYSTVTKIGRLMIIVYILAFIAMIWIIFLMLKIFLKPLQNVREVINNISIGDLTGIIDVQSVDEVGAISTDVNQLVKGLQDVFGRMKTDVEILNISIHELSSSSQEISTTSNEQASAVREIVTTMEDSEVLTKSIENKINVVAEISNKIKEMINAGVNNVEESLVKMNEISISNDDTINGIRSLSEKIEAIWEIVSIINGIADQTKIIAFNAELEASAAGEAGKNFQIVASEIRRLADSTVNSTSEIKSKIKEIQYSSDRLITASEDGTTKIRDGGTLTEKLHQVFEGILETSDISASSAEEISFSIKQMVEAFEQILMTLKQISEGINDFVISTKSTSDISQKLKDVSDQMAEFLDYYKIEVQEE